VQKKTEFEKTFSPKERWNEVLYADLDH